MSQEQLDAIKEQLWSEDNDGLSQSVFCAYLEAPERGANMIIDFANNKGLKVAQLPMKLSITWKPWTMKRLTLK